MLNNKTALKMRILAGAGLLVLLTSMVLIQTENANAFSGKELDESSSNTVQTSSPQTEKHSGWMAAAPMSVARLGHSMVELPPGPNPLGLSRGPGKVMVIGGFSFEPLFVPSPQPLASCEIYDPVSNTWTQAAPHPVAAGWRWAVLLQNGMVLVVGGATDLVTIFNSSHLYDPKTNKWIATKPLPIAITNPHAVMRPILLPNGQVLIAGGIDQNGLNEALSGAPLPGWSKGSYLFTLNWRDPSLSSWDYTRDRSDGRISRMPSARTTSAVILMKNGKVLNVGGLGPTLGATETATNTATLFDPKTGLWTPAAPMPPVYGLQEDESIAVYPTGPGSRWAPFSQNLDNGEVLVAGGTAGQLEDNVGRSSAVIYDPDRDTWRITTPMHFRRSPGVWSATLPATGEILCAGPGVPPTSVFSVHDLTGEIFDLATAEWTFAPPEGGPPNDNSLDSFESQSVQLSIGNLQIAGGADLLTDTTATAQSWIYVP